MPFANISMHGPGFKESQGKAADLPVGEFCVKVLSRCHPGNVTPFLDTQPIVWRGAEYMQIDAGALAPGCALIASVKTRLSPDDVKALNLQGTMIQQGVDDGIPELQQSKGKHLYSECPIALFRRM